MKKLIPALAVLMAATTAFAEFEGVVHMKFTTPQGGGTAKIFISKKGSRNETDIQHAQMSIKMTTLFLRDNPGFIYQIHDDRKSYAEINLKDAAGKMPKGGDEKYVVKNLGQETVQGYLCRHVLVIQPAGGESELWTSRDILDYKAYADTHAGGAGDGAGAGFLKALKDAGADGFPVKSIHRGKKKGGEMTMELVKVEKQSLPDSLFRVPSDYKKTDGFGPVGAGMPPEAQKAMEEQMKGMTPDKREMLEKMLKSRGLK